MLARCASTKEPRQGKRYTAAKFLVDQIYYLDRELKRKNLTLQEERLTLLDRLEVVQEERNRYVWAAERTDALERELEEMKGSSRDAEMTEVFQLTEILQAEVKEKDTYIETLRAKIQELEDRISLEGDPKGLITFLSQKVSDLSVAAYITPQPSPQRSSPKKPNSTMTSLAF